MQLLLDLRVTWMFQGKALRFFRRLFLSFIFSWLRLVLPTDLVQLLHNIALCHLFDILDLSRDVVRLLVFRNIHIWMFDYVASRFYNPFVDLLLTKVLRAWLVHAYLVYRLFRLVWLVEYLILFMISLILNVRFRFVILVSNFDFCIHLLFIFLQYLLIVVNFII